LLELPPLLALPPLLPLMPLPVFFLLLPFPP
jgi:hypothetical protein